MKTRLAAVLYMEVRGVLDESVWNLKVCGVVFGALKCGVWVR